MLLIEYVLRSLGLLRPPSTRLFELDEMLHASLQDLAAQERRPVSEVAADLLQQALSERQAADASLGRWQALSPRQQHIAALVCLGYTNRQIAARLVISPETVKTHIHSLLQKFGVRTRTELRHALRGWDFSAWE